MLLVTNGCLVLGLSLPVASVSGDQGSPSVLATLAALAEATAPNASEPAFSLSPFALLPSVYLMLLCLVNACSA